MQTSGSTIGDDYTVIDKPLEYQGEIKTAFGKYTTIGTRVRVEYTDSVYTGTVAEYNKTSSGTWVIQIKLDGGAGIELKGFLATKKPRITNL